VQILFVSAYGLPHMGGIEVAVDTLAAELSERGHAVSHVTSSAGAQGPDSPSPSYIQRRVPSLNPLETRLGVPYPLFSPRLITTLHSEISRADVVHAHGYLYPGSVAAATLCRRVSPRTPLVLTEHVGHVPYDSAVLDRAEALAIRGLGRHVLRRADAVITYNDRVAGQLAELCPSASLTTILNGVDTDLFRPAGPGERERLRDGLGWDDGPRVLFAGRPVAKKGFPDAVRAVEEAGLPALNLVVAGAERLPAGTPARVTALGLLPRERLAQVYRACEAMIVPARGEGFPLAAQEALASGLPLILADDPGYAPNLVGAGAAVHLVGERSRFGGALSELLCDPEALEVARQAAATHARSAFSWARTADEHETLYESLLAEPAAAQAS
jgi:glycosyltransferase involved in cell wall biosynthesis